MHEVSVSEAKHLPPWLQSHLCTFPSGFHFQTAGFPQWRPSLLGLSQPALANSQFMYTLISIVTKHLHLISFTHPEMCLTGSAGRARYWTCVCILSSSYYLFTAGLYIHANTHQESTGHQSHTKEHSFQVNADVNTHQKSQSSTHQESQSRTAFQKPIGCAKGSLSMSAFYRYLDALQW